MRKKQESPMDRVPVPAFTPDMPPELVHTCRMGECVLFAGAGLSARVGFPVWNEFLGGLLAFARDSKIIDSAFATPLEAALQEGDRETVADGVVGAFGNHRNLLQDYVRHAFPDSIAPSAAHNFLSQIPFNSVLTSNYDDLLERALPKFAQTGVFTPKDAELLLDALSQKRPFILKLYGDVNKPETLIFSHIEYREAVSSNVSFLKFMEGYFFSRTFLFVGLSLEGIQEFLSSITFRGSNPRQHFALVAMGGSAAKARADLLLRRYNIQVIPFAPSEDFSGLDKFIENLSLETRPAGSMNEIRQPLASSIRGIRRVVLEDIGPFEKLELDFPREKNWKILLGDNGVGKSTILKAIAVAIIGGDARSYASRLVRAGKTRGRITLITEQNPSGYITEILTKDMMSEAEVISIPSRPMEAEGWLALGFSPLRVVTWSASTGPQPMVQKGRPTADDLIPLLSGESDPRMDHLKQWIVNLDAADKTSHLMGLQELRTLQGHEKRVSSIAFSADGRTLLSGSIDTTIRLWDIATGREVRRIAAHESGVNAVALSADGKRAASGSFHGSVKIWDLESDIALRVLKNTSQVLSVALSADAGTLVVGSEDGSIGIWNQQSGEELKLINGSHHGDVWSVSLSADGRTLISGSEDGSVRVWETGSGREIRTLVRGPNPVWSVAMDGDGHRAVAGFKDGSVRVWELETGAEVQILENLGDEVMAVTMAADGRSVLSGSGGGMIKRSDLDPVRQTGVVRAHRSAIWSVAISPDGQTMASGSEDKSIKLWTVTLPQPILSPFETIDKFFDVISALTDRKDIEFLRVTDNFRVYVKVAGVPSGVPVEVLSQGLTSLFGWVGVLCQRLKETLQGPTSDPLPNESYALVLIDEIDAHMHPRWQQVLVPRLKSAFPNIQFIACTHSPLIVGGLDKKEVTRFSMANGGIAQIDFDPDMTLGRTDQILTGELFNLSTTLDSATQDMMTEYEKLLGKSLRSPEEEKRFMALGNALEERIPPSPSAPVLRRARELLETLQSANLKNIDADVRTQVEERMARLSKTLRGDES